MKAFNIKIALFSLILLLIFIFNCLLNYAIFYSLRPPVHNVKIMIAGDSHPQSALNPIRFDSAINISQGAEPYVLTYWKLKYLFKHCKPDILLLGFAHHNISSFNDMKFWNEYWSSVMFKRSYIIGDFLALNNIDIDYQEYFKTFFRQMCLFPHTKHLNFIGSYTNNNDSNLSDFKEAIERHYYYYRHEELGISNTAILYLDNILNLCRRNDVIPVLIGSPVSKEYFTLIPSSIKKKYTLEKNRLIKQNIVVLDFTNYFYEDSFYLDGDHLNEKGAMQFSDEIAYLLKTIN